MLRFNTLKIALIFCACNVTGFYHARLPVPVNANGSYQTPIRTASLLKLAKNAETKRLITTPIPYSLNTIETLCMEYMDQWYSKSLSLKCPFMRRRMADLLDGVDMVMRFLIIRHKSLDLIGPPPGCRSCRVSQSKVQNLPMEDLKDIIRRDWREDTNKGYYISGRMSTAIYRDDCLFDGPDPDMPVRGLRKYLNAASQLFDHSSSTATLLSLETVDSHTIEARWRIEGVLHLPWHPKVPAWTGSTMYHFDEDGLIHRHEESWDISVLRAFTQTLLPEAAGLIWNEATE
eukprot:scaffold1475_cov111-Cylindrotheca_fusiformis.AAC.12